MAAPRTFRFYGLGYGNSNVSLTVTVGSNQVFSGEIPTVDQPLSEASNYNPSSWQTLFTIADSNDYNSEFAGNVATTIEVTGGLGVVFGKIDSNYLAGNTFTETGAGSPTVFGPSYSGKPVNSDGTVDPRSSVAINGVVQPRATTPAGAWNWVVLSGDTMTYNWNISLGQESNVPPV